jgi:quercetin dioxygenase-like cupin family protein
MNGVFKKCMSLIGRNVMRAHVQIIFVVAVTLGSFGCANQSPDRPNTVIAAPTIQSDPPSKKITVLLTQPLSDPAGKEVRVMTVEYPPGVRSAPHRHPGAIFAYVLEGEVLCQVEGQPLRTYRAGEVWYEYPQQLHQVSGNASATLPAKLLVFFLTEAGKHVVLPER